MSEILSVDYVDYGIDTGEKRYQIELNLDTDEVHHVYFFEGDVRNKFNVGEAYVIDDADSRTVAFEDDTLVWGPEDRGTYTAVLTDKNNGDWSSVEDIELFGPNPTSLKEAAKGFDGFSHESLPSVGADFSCKSSVNARQPEAVVDIKHNNQWIRLPITAAETRINKDGPADLTATTRVDLPVTWGRRGSTDEKVQIHEYVGADRESEEATSFDLARVFYWNQYTEEYTVEQFGYVASVGPAPQNGTFRFYVYDTADLMKNISVTKTYDNPTASGVTNFVAYDEQYGVEANSPIPIRAVSTTAPEENVEILGSIQTMRKNVHGWLDENTVLKKFDGDPEDDQITGWREWLDDKLHAGGHKHFRRNRHTLIDVMEWLTDEIGGAWYFEPTATGVVLMVNNGGEEGSFKIARSAYYDGHFDPEGLEYINGFNPSQVDILHNSSLEDLKPINYLELGGESAASFLGQGPEENLDDDIGPQGAPLGHSDKYPHVEVRYPPLLNRTGGRKLGPRPLESGKTTLAEAEEQAVKEFKKRHEDNTDGSMEVRALPPIRPYDYIAAVPVCNDTFGSEMQPIQYEVNSVRHEVTADEPYKTVLGVSIALDEDQIETDATFKELNQSE